MADEKKYITIMIESLQKKEALLDTLLIKNEAQSACIQGREYEDIKWDSFQVLMAEKDTAIGRINELDDGFEALYARVQDALRGNKEAYAEEIHAMQELITRITDKGMAIRAGEETNRSSIERILGSAKQQIRQSKASVKAASDYYKTMSKAITVEPHFLDQKK